MQIRIAIIILVILYVIESENCIPMGNMQIHFTYSSFKHKIVTI